MEFFTKTLIILAVILLTLALGDSIFSGLFSNGGYHPVTQQMKEVMTGAQWVPFFAPFNILSLIFIIFLQIVHIFATGCSYLARILYFVS